ncbi:MAG: SAM hydroxide adenosyltransferase, partial [Candidatus Binatia bacterium]
VFAPVAAHAARGVAASELGTIVEDFARIEVPAVRRVEGAVEGRVIHVDRFGNLISNVRRDDLVDFRAEDLSVSIGGVQISGLSPHYAAVGEGKPLALWNSWGRLEVAVRNSSAARQLRVRADDRVQVRFRERRG